MGFMRFRRTTAEHLVTDVKYRGWTLYCRLHLDGWNLKTIPPGKLMAWTRTEGKFENMEAAIVRGKWLVDQQLGARGLAPECVEGPDGSCVNPAHIHRREKKVRAASAGN